MLTAFIAVCLALPMQAFATEMQEDSQRIELSQNENKVDVAVTSSVAAREEISSLQLSLKVVSTGDADIQFVPNSSLPAKIVDSRYHADTETLNIYVAGGTALFDKSSPTCRLGSLVVASKDGVVTVSALEGSLKYVTGTELAVQEGDIEYPAAVNLTFQGDNIVPDENGGSSGGTGSTGENTQGTGSAGGSGAGTGTTGGRGNAGNNGGTITTGSTDGADVPMIDESGLRDALAHAAEYAEEDYTAESYQRLKEAVAKAEELLDRHGVTQEELDEARLMIENAIGMLELQNDSPVVQPENSSEEKDGEEESKTQEKSGILDGLPLSVPVLLIILAVVLIIIGVIVFVSWRRNRWLDD